MTRVAAVPPEKPPERPGEDGRDDAFDALLTSLGGPFDEGAPARAGRRPAPSRAREPAREAPTASSAPHPLMGATTPPSADPGAPPREPGCATLPAAAAPRPSPSAAGGGDDVPVGVSVVGVSVAEVPGDAPTRVVAGPHEHEVAPRDVGAASGPGATTPGEPDAAALAAPRPPLPRPGGEAEATPAVRAGPDGDGGAAGEGNARPRAGANAIAGALRPRRPDLAASRASGAMAPEPTAAVVEQVATAFERAPTTAVGGAGAAAPPSASPALASVFEQVRIALKPAAGEARVVLTPPELGLVDVRLRLRGGALVAEVSAERADVQAELERRRGELAASLGERTALEVTVSVVARPEPGATGATGATGAGAGGDGAGGGRPDAPPLPRGAPARASAARTSTSAQVPHASVGARLDTFA